MAFGIIIKNVVLVYGGELARDVASQIEQSQPDHALPDIAVRLQSAADRPNKLVDAVCCGGDNDGSSSSTVVCYILQTIENAAPTEDGGVTVRFFQRKTHGADLLSSNNGVFQYAVFGLGDSNLLLDRQTTTAQDCNQVAIQLDARLTALGGRRFHPLGLADERTGLTEVEPWIKSFWEAVGNSCK
jgi:sulfite reductase alpha subunit-like flavoprotein